MESLKLFVRKMSGASEEQWSEFSQFLKKKTVKAGELLFKQGTSSEMVGFVISGLVYTYYSSSKGENHVKKFCWEGRVFSPYSTLLTGAEACYFSAVAAEDSEIVYINYSDLVRLFERDIVWERMGRKIVEESLIERERREYESFCLNLEERYQSFTQTHAKILNRIPQYLIASYLGINTATLSRLRAKTVKSAKN